MDSNFLADVGRILRDDDNFIDVQLDGRDLRNLAVEFAAANAESLSDDDRAHLSAVFGRFTQGDLFGRAVNFRIYKNLYSAANERPNDNPK